MNADFLVHNSKLIKRHQSMFCMQGLGSGTTNGELVRAEETCAQDPHGAPTHRIPTCRGSATHRTKVQSAKGISQAYMSVATSGKGGVLSIRQIVAAAGNAIGGDQPDHVMAVANSLSGPLVMPSLLQ